MDESKKIDVVYLNKPFEPFEGFFYGDKVEHIRIEEIEVVKEFRFEAAHRLPEYDGPCGEVHGHSYKLFIGAKGRIKKNGMVCDFSTLKKTIEEEVITKLDHKYLNEIKEANFPFKCPTAENMVLWIKDVLDSNFYSFIRLYETQTSYAEWRRE